MAAGNDLDLRARLERLEAENARLSKINKALIERVEAGGAVTAAPYAAFEHAVVLAEQVRERTEALSVALSDLKRSNAALKQEISERRAIEEQLRTTKQEAEQANLSKTKFLAAVSHDLLQPLNAARLFNGVLMEQTLPENTQKLIRSANTSLADVENLLGTLVDISKLDAGVITPDLAAFRLSDLLDNLATEYRQVAHSEGLRFRWVRSSAVVHSDAALLARILRNFLTNAMRYTPRGGRVLLGCRRRQGRLVVEVWDTGPGIPEDNFSEIFIEFKRVRNPSGGHDKGLGLGLAIVDKIARMLSHDIGVRSRIGRGSVFSVSLPFGELPSRTEPPALEIGDLEGRLRHANIWIIDNDPAICEGMSTLLNSWGCHVTSGLSLANLNRQLALDAPAPDLIIADYKLDNDQTGIDVVQVLQDTLTPVPPVLIITANYSRELKQWVEALGFTLMNKPIRPMKLKATLTHLLAGRDVQDVSSGLGTAGEIDIARGKDRL